MGPIPLNATPLFPRSIAASTNAILFTAIPLPALGAAPANTGSIWQLSLLTGTAFPRLNLGPGVTNTIQGRTVLTAPANGSAIVSFEFNGTLRLYDPLSDAFAITRTAAVTGFRGTASASDDGNIFLMDDTVFNRALGFQGRMTPGGVTASNTFGVAAAGGNALRIQPGTTAAPTQMLQLFNLTTFQIQQQFPMPEAAMDITPAAATAAVTTRVWPPRPVALEIGVTGQTQLLPHGMVVDGSNNAYLLTVSGLSIVSLASSGGRTPSFNASGVVNGASFMPQISAGGLITIFGSNLADNDSAPGVPLPTVLGGVCVTANELPIPLLYTSPTQINAQLPPNVTGRVTLAVRSPTLGLASAGVQVNVTATAPGVFTTNVDGQTRALLFHSNDFSFVTPDHPAHRDEVLILYATGLGPVNPSVQAGMPAPSNPPSSTTQDITVAIGGHQFDLQFAGLAPGFVGAYQLNIYVPGDRLQGDNLPVVITAGGATSTAANPPLAAIH